MTQDSCNEHMTVTAEGVVGSWPRTASLMEVGSRTESLLPGQTPARVRLYAHIGDPTNSHWKRTSRMRYNSLWLSVGVAEDGLPGSELTTTEVPR